MILIIIIIETCANISRVRTNSFRTINACVSIGFMNEQAGRTDCLVNRLVLTMPFIHIYVCVGSSRVYVSTRHGNVLP